MRLSFLVIFAVVISIIQCTTTGGDIDGVENKPILNAIRKFVQFVRMQLLEKSSRGLDADMVVSAGVKIRFMENMRAIFPGTLWCGDGTIAKANDELGYFKLADACCRDHDSCPDAIEAGSSKHGLENPGLFTRSSCECDVQFRKCLKAANSLIANNIGFTYFTLLGPQCFKLEHPKVKCKRKRWFRCSVYKLNFTENSIYQWLDNQYY